MIGRWLNILLLTLFVAPFVWAQSRVDSVSESGDSLVIRSVVGLTTAGVGELGLGGDAREVLRDLRSAVAIDSTYAPAHYYLAKMLTQSDPDSALLHSRVAYLSDTTNYWYLSEYAQNAIGVRDYKRAHELYTKIVELRPTDLNAYRILAILYQQESRPYQAIAILDTAEVRVGQNPYLVALKRQLLLATNQRERAVSEARAMVDAMPFLAENRVALAELYGDMGRDSVAMVEYGEAMKIDSTRLESLLSMGNFLKSRKRDREYLWIIRRIMSSGEIGVKGKIRLVRDITSDSDLYRREHLFVSAIVSELLINHPNDVDAVELQSQHLISIGMIDEALAVLKRHLDDEPPQLRLYRAVIDIEQYLGHRDSAAYYLDRAIDRFPDEISLHYELVYALAAQNQYNEAIAMLKEELDGASDSLRSTVWGSVGDLHHQKALYESRGDSLSRNADRNFRRALRPTFRAYDSALDADGDNSMVLNNYAYFLCEYGGDLDRAFAMAQRAIEIETSSPTFLDTYAWILYRLGRYDEAKVAMRRAISLDTTNNYEIALHYGAILYALGEDTMAGFYWDKAREWGGDNRVIEACRAEAERRRLEKQRRDDD